MGDNETAGTKILNATITTATTGLDVLNTTLKNTMEGGQGLGTVLGQVASGLGSVADMAHKSNDKLVSLAGALGKVAAVGLKAAGVAVEWSDKWAGVEKQIARTTFATFDLTKSAAQLPDIFSKTGDVISAAMKMTGRDAKEVTENFKALGQVSGKLGLGFDEIAARGSAAIDPLTAFEQVGELNRKMMAASLITGTEYGDTINYMSSAYKNLGESGDTALGSFAYLKKATEGTGLTFPDAIKKVTDMSSSFKQLGLSSMDAAKAIAFVAKKQQEMASQGAYTFKSQDAALESMSKAYDGVKKATQDWGQALFFTGVQGGGMREAFDWMMDDFDPSQRAAQMLGAIGQITTGGDVLTAEEAKDTGRYEEFVAQNQMISAQFGTAPGRETANVVSLLEEAAEGGKQADAAMAELENLQKSEKQLLGNLLETAKSTLPRIQDSGEAINRALADKIVPLMQLNREKVGGAANIAVDFAGKQLDKLKDLVTGKSEEAVSTADAQTLGEAFKALKEASESGTLKADAGLGDIRGFLQEKNIKLSPTAEKLLEKSFSETTERQKTNNETLTSPTTERQKTNENIFSDEKLALPTPPTTERPSTEAEERNENIPPPPTTERPRTTTGEKLQDKGPKTGEILKTLSPQQLAEAGSGLNVREFGEQFKASETQKRDFVAGRLSEGEISAEEARNDLIQLNQEKGNREFEAEKKRLAQDTKLSDEARKKKLDAKKVEIDKNQTKYVEDLKALSDQELKKASSKGTSGISRALRQKKSSIAQQDPTGQLKMRIEKDAPGVASGGVAATDTTLANVDFSKLTGQAGKRFETVSKREKERWSRSLDLVNKSQGIGLESKDPKLAKAEQMRATNRLAEMRPDTEMGQKAIAIQMLQKDAAAGSDSAKKQLEQMKANLTTFKKQESEKVAQTGQTSGSSGSPGGSRDTSTAEQTQNQVAPTTPQPPMEIIISGRLEGQDGLYAEIKRQHVEWNPHLSGSDT